MSAKDNDILLNFFEYCDTCRLRCSVSILWLPVRWGWRAARCSPSIRCPSGCACAVQGGYAGCAIWRLGARPECRQDHWLAHRLERQQSRRRAEGGNWTVFNDATLNRLQADAAGNPSVEQAVARLRAAQASSRSPRRQLPSSIATGSGSRALAGGGTYRFATNGDNVARSGSIRNNFSLGLSAS